ncbi:MAG TPA: GxxExxY protein [Acidobacteriaceae bacterium]|jgi:GxxExxY protein|nr:GxxExxY protein [Acidobacteriaceae bacterium]
MNADKTTRFEGKHSELTDAILSVFYEVYNELGNGFLESVYRNAMSLALQQRGYEVAMEVPIPVYFRNTKVGDFRADLIVNNTVLLELKSLNALEKSHEGQILHYLKATPLEVGLLCNFGPKPQFKRFVFDNERKLLRGKL